MKKSNGSVRHLRKPTDAKRRAQLLAAFDRSGVSAAAFARQHGIQYTTFCGWRQRRAKAALKFVEVELPEVPVPVELMVELGSHVRFRISDASQVELAVRLIQTLKASTAC